jgi:hypothetical protein
MLANLFLHYAFDTWMTRNHPGIRFERYADDAICHCTSEAEASALRRSLEERFADCGLTLHPEKTKMVYCKDDDRRGTYPNQKFDFLGYTFRPRLSRRRRDTFGVSFSPAASDKALKAIRHTVRSWRLHERSDKTLDDLARRRRDPAPPAPRRRARGCAATPRHAARHRWRKSDATHAEVRDYEGMAQPSIRTRALDQGALPSARSRLRAAEISARWVKA